MRRALLAALAAVACAACAPPGEPAPPPETQAAHVHFVVGNRLNKSVYDDGDETVVSFQIRVTNGGPDTGRSPDPECHTVLDHKRVPLEILENPELEPGGSGWLRTGGAVPRLTPAEADNLEPYCEL